MTSQERTANLERIARAAVASQESHGIPAEVTTAQCILESGWLANAPGNNPFGIKEYIGCPGRQLLATTEWFTDAELAAFLARGDGRKAVLVTPEQTSGARRKYSAQDWFAAFPSLSAAFVKHAALLLQKEPYASATRKYLEDGNLNGYVDAIAKTYATSLAYASTVVKIIEQDNVRAAIARARWKNSYKETI